MHTLRPLTLAVLLLNGFIRALFHVWSTSWHNVLVLCWLKAVFEAQLLDYLWVIPGLGHKAGANKKRGKSSTCCGTHPCILCVSRSWKLHWSSCECAACWSECLGLSLSEAESMRCTLLTHWVYQFVNVKWKKKKAYEMCLIARLDIF